MDQLLVGETSPYIFSLEKLIFEHDFVSITADSIESNQYDNFSTILQIASSLGSVSLFKALNLESKAFFLGEKLRIRKIITGVVNNNICFKAKSIVLSKRKGKALVDIFNTNSDLAYSFELDYNVLLEDAFHKLFKPHYTETTNIFYNDKLPDVKLKTNSEYDFSIMLSPFSVQNCIGHFNGYPIVPAVFIVDRLLNGIKQWITQMFPNTLTTIHVDSLEIFANIAMPINTKFEAKIIAKKLSGNIIFFTCSLINEQIEYSSYLITIKI